MGFWNMDVKIILLHTDWDFILDHHFIIEIQLSQIQILYLFFVFNFQKNSIFS